MIFRMRYQKMIKTTAPKILIILSSLNIAVACADTNFVPHTATSIKTESSNFTEEVKNIKNPERLRSVCDAQKKAEYCFNYAAYQDLVLEDYQLAYEYHMKAFDLGEKESGVLIGHYQVNYPEQFTDSNRLNIDESIYYLEQAFKAGYPDATRLLMMIYRDPKFNRINYTKAEYYNKIAIKQNVKKSRGLLAYLYIHHMKDKSKGDESIQLLKADLLLEKNWESALALMNIYLYPEDYGASIEPDLVKTLAYAYVSSDLRDGRHEDEFNNVDTRFVEAMQTELPPETLKQAKAMYLNLMAKMNDKNIS